MTSAELLAAPPCRTASAGRRSAGFDGVAALAAARRAVVPMLSRLVRTAAFVAASLALAIVAHVVGGGEAPPTSVALAAGAVLSVCGLAVTGRERGLGFITAAVVSTQLLAHVAFALAPLLVGAGSGQDQTAIWARILFCHHGPSPITAGDVAAARATSGLSHAALPAGYAQPHVNLLSAVTSSWWLVAMLAAHLAAATVMAWWLRRGERRAWQLVRRAAQAVGTRFSHVCTGCHRIVNRQQGVAVLDDHRPRLAEQLWTSVLHRRGPPARS